jgi:hypothetical protein
MHCGKSTLLDHLRHAREMLCIGYLDEPASAEFLDAAL